MAGAPPPTRTSIGEAAHRTRVRAHRVPGPVRRLEVARPLRDQLPDTLGMHLFIARFSHALAPPVGGVGEGMRPSPDQYWLYFIYLLVLPIPLRALVTWGWNSTRGSVIIIALVHGAWDTTNGTGFIP